MKVAIGVPAQDTCQSMFAYDWAMLAANWQRRHPGDEMCMMIHRGTLIADQREMLVAGALSKKCDRILFIDSDMRFPKDALDRLESHKKPFVAANYPTRRYPIQAVASSTTKGPWQHVPTRFTSTGIEEVNAVGLGLALIHTDVFRKLPQPWFQIGYHGDIKQYYGEDVWLCRLMTAHGYKMYIDHDLSKEVAHIGVKEFSFADMTEG